MIIKQGTFKTLIIDGSKLRPAVWEFLKRKADYISTEEGRLFPDFITPFGEYDASEDLEAEDLEEYSKLMNNVTGHNNCEQVKVLWMED